MRFSDDIVERMKKAAKEMLQMNEQRKLVQLDLGDSYLVLATSEIGLVAAQTIEVDGKQFFFGFDEKKF